MLISVYFFTSHQCENVVLTVLCQVVDERGGIRLLDFAQLYCSSFCGSIVGRTVFNFDDELLYSLDY